MGPHSERTADARISRRKTRLFPLIHRRPQAPARALPESSVSTPQPAKRRFRCGDPGATVPSMKALKILLFCIGCAASAAAQTPPQQSPDQKTIADCVTAANAKGQFGGQCVGIVAEPCIAKLQPDIAS